MKQRSAWLLCFLLFFAGVLGGCKPKEPSEETDWREQYNSTATPEVTDTSKKEDPSGTPAAGKIPTPTPVPEFVPKAEQTELALYLSFNDWFDESKKDALNRLLQERGYSFYVTIRENNSHKYWNQISSGYNNEWQDMLDAGEKVDLIYLDGMDTDKTYELFGDFSITRAIQGGYLLPFSQYPETDAKRHLLSAYPESFWELNSFRGEIYGVYGSVMDVVKYGYFTLFNLDAAEQAGIEAPEQLELTNLDAMLQQAEDAGIPGMNSLAVCYGERRISAVPCGLSFKYEQDGTYRIVNPTEDSGREEIQDAGNRYRENGWVDVVSDTTIEGKLPLIIYGSMDYINRNGGVYSTNYQVSVNGKPVDVKKSARVKVYGEEPRVLIEGREFGLLGIPAASKCKEEAVELLSLMHTDEEVVKLLRYGIEGIHYRVDEEGKLEQIKSGGYFSPINRFMHLEFEETLGMTNGESDYYEGIAGIIKLPYLDDLTEEQKERLKKIRKITFSDSPLTKDEKRAALAEAGYDELAKEINEAHGWE